MRSNHDLSNSRVQEIQLSDTPSRRVHSNMAAPAPIIPAVAANPHVQNEPWIENPLVGDFNPGTAHGRHIFKIKTQGLPDDKRFEASPNESSSLSKYLIGKRSNLGTAARVPIEYNAAGDPTKFADLITQHQSITFEDMQRASQRRFATALASGDPIPVGKWALRVLDPANVASDKTTFYNRVDSNVTLELIKNSLSSTGWTRIIAGKQNLISYTCSNTGAIVVDGPSVLWLLLDRVDPSLIVSVETLRAKIETMKLHTYKNDVGEMITDIEEAYRKILDSGSSCESILRYTLNALLSGPSQDFNTFVKAIKSDVESGIGQHKSITYEQLVVAARKKYRNMIESGDYNAVDPKSAQIMALVTRIQTLEKGRAATTGTQSHILATDGKPKPASVDGKDRTPVGTYKIEKWRTIRTSAPSITDGGKTYHWCSKHKRPGDWDGLYVTHTEEEHEDAKNRTGRFARYGNGGGQPPANQGAPSNQGANNLVIGERLKEVLCGQLMMNDEDADKYCAKIIQGKD